MRHRILFLALALIGVCAPLEAIDVPEITFMPTAASTGTLPGSPAFGTFPPFVPQPVNFCSGNTLAAGLLVSHNGSNVTGLALRCRNFGVIGATETSPVFDQPLLGSTAGSTSRMLECDSGEAITGLRVRHGTLIDAVGISCHAVSPSFGTVVNFVDVLFLTGRGAVVNAGATSLVTGLIGGGGGTLTAFECGTTTPFVRALQTPTSGGIIGLKASCSRVLTKPIDHAATQPDLTPRTVSQRRSLSLGSTDAFRVEVFNLGGPIPNPGASAFVDVIFLSSDVAMTAVPPECDQISSGRFRCAIPGIDGLSDGGLASLNGFIVQANGPRTETALFVVQTSFDIDDSDFGNNTYGFAVNVH